MANDAPPTLGTACDMYRQLMEEVKLRIASYAAQLSVVTADRESPSAYLSVEYCYLQMRYLCELVALAALTANASGTDELPPKKLLNEWHPEQLFRQLEMINPSCYPLPAVETRREGILHFKRSPADYLRRSALAGIYGRCGDALHRGTVGQMLAGKRKPYDIDELLTWNGQIYHLLSQHFVFLPHLKTALLVLLGDASRPAQVIVAGAADGGDYIVNDPMS